MIRVAETAIGDVVNTFEMDIFPFVSALSPDGTRLAVAGPDTDSLPVFDVRTGDVLVELENTPSVNTVSWSPNGRWIATGDVDSSVRVWDAATGALEERLLGHTGNVISVEWSPDSRRIVSGGTDGTADIERSFDAGSVTVVQVAFSPDGERIATGGDDATIRLFDIDAGSGAQVLALRGHASVVSGLSARTGTGSSPRLPTASCARGPSTSSS
jgi:Tol biopolymer transport system component